MKWLIPAFVLMVACTPPERPPRKDHTDRQDGVAVRVASLDLCADEYALLLARPGQFVSISWLGADPRESPLAAKAVGLHQNDGSIASVIALRPDVILTSRRRSATQLEMAHRLGVSLVDIDDVTNLDKLIENIRKTSKLFDNKEKGENLIAQIMADFGTEKRHGKDMIFLQAGGTTIPADGFAATLFAHMGLQQRAIATRRLSLEYLLMYPPEILVETRYHDQETSRAQGWLDMARREARKGDTAMMAIDGRPWTCIGPGTIAALPGLRARLQQQKTHP